MIKKRLSPIYKMAISIFVLIVFFEVTGYFDGGYRPSDSLYYWTFYKKDKQELEEYYSLKIKFQVTRSDYKQNWLDYLPDSVLASPVTQDNRKAKLLRLISAELKKYPRHLIQNNIKILFFLEVLAPFGTGIGGNYDNSKGVIYLATQSKKTGSVYMPSSIIKAFNHEFSSILLENHPFSEKKWRAASGKNFQYEQDKDPTYQWMYLNGYAEEIDLELLRRRGLIKQYGETGVENDFNIYAENIFVNPKKMKRLIAEYPIIKRKYEVFKEFYLSIDKGFAPVFAKIDE